MTETTIKDRLVNAKGAPKPLLLLIFSLLLLRSRLLTGPRQVIRSLRSVTSKHRASGEELSRAWQQLYVKDADGTERLLVPYEGHIKEVRFYAQRRDIPKEPLSYPSAPPHNRSYLRMHTDSPRHPLRINHASTKPSSDNYLLSFALLFQVTILRRLSYSLPIPPSSSSEQCLASPSHALMAALCAT